MSKGASSFIVTLLALLLVSPIVGVNNSGVEQNSKLLPDSNRDLARGDYEVSVEFADISSAALYEKTWNV